MIRARPGKGSGIFTTTEADFEMERAVSRKIVGGLHDARFAWDLKLRQKKNTPLGAAFDMRWEGMAAESVESGGPADKSGLKERDILKAVNKKSIRYTKMADVLELLNQKGKIIVTIERPVTVFRR